MIKWRTSTQEWENDKILEKKNVCEACCGIVEEWGTNGLWNKGKGLLSLVLKHQPVATAITHGKLKQHFKNKKINLFLQRQNKRMYRQGVYRNLSRGGA